MKLKNIFKIIGCLGLLISLNSCQKYIDLKPENATYDEIFWKDADNISKATNGLYYQLRNAHRHSNSYFIFGDVASGNFKVGADHWNMTRLSIAGNFYFNYAAYLEEGLWNWTRYYEIINQANRIISFAELIKPEDFEEGQEEKSKLIAEARFIRAYVNFYMQRIWGDIILVKQPFLDPQNVEPIGRAPQDETLAFCIEDLKAAIDVLDNSSKTRASKAAAQALLAHVYAWGHDYPNAEKYANDVINSSYSLESTADIRNIWKGDSKESIFELNMLYSESGDEFSQDFFNIFLTDPTVKGKGTNSTFSLNVEYLDEYFQDEEARLDSTFRFNGTNYYLRKYDNVIYYLKNRTDVYAVSNNLVIFRLADIYLLRAEAEFKNGKIAPALSDLNKIRNRAGLTSITASGEELYTEIFKERRRELLGEASTQYDLIRMGFLNKLEFADFYSESRIAAKGYYWPLDMRALLPTNPLLTQNPWWGNN